MQALELVVPSPRMYSMYPTILVEDRSEPSDSEPYDLSSSPSLHTHSPDIKDPPRSPPLVGISRFGSPLSDFSLDSPDGADAVDEVIRALERLSLNDTPLSPPRTPAIVSSPRAFGLTSSYKHGSRNDAQPISIKHGASTSDVVHHNDRCLTLPSPPADHRLSRTNSSQLVNMLWNMHVSNDSRMLDVGSPERDLRFDVKMRIEVDVYEHSPHADRIQGLEEDQTGCGDVNDHSGGLGQEESGDEEVVDGNLGMISSRDGLQKGFRYTNLFAKLADGLAKKTQQFVQMFLELKDAVTSGFSSTPSSHDAKSTPQKFTAIGTIQNCRFEGSSHLLGQIASIPFDPVLSNLELLDGPDNVYHKPDVLSALVESNHSHIAPGFHPQITEGRRTKYQRLAHSRDGADLNSLESITVSAMRPLFSARFAMSSARI
ncbi:hypothetical protein JAAARDRAFT_59192 [Jaapia argillacea MUCL 33604]|uniref:Uncharacterized protein n=1 Tax=Jaapia argillacea MUCL 33604 TaxID=933084 RepID=A0A067PYE0_9AGAM|nr:hypothetical protein JAAARDRAFT_59192 [Jaapia argillacea MUCL 33604]